MRIFHSLGHVVGGTLLIAGTAIGVGMLALPVATGPAGFLPSVTIYLLCWAFMLCSGLLLVEACLWMPPDTSFISMAEKILGPIGKGVFWVVYLFLFVTVMIAHCDGGGEVLLDITGWSLPGWLATTLYTLVLVPIVYLGAHAVDRINMILISGVLICYLAFVGVSFDQVRPELLSYAKWHKAWAALPVLFTAFTYQVIIPSLMTYMERDAKKVRLSIILGSTLPLVIYLVWQVLIMGIIPAEGPHGLIEAKNQGLTAVAPLKQFVKSPYLFLIGKYFAFFAMTTSFVPLALSFFDFLGDGLKWKKTGIRRVILCAITFGVPLVIAILWPHLFLVALGYAGGISCSFLFGIMPPVLAWTGRYIKKYPGERQLPGGKPLLLFLMLFALGVTVGLLV